MDKYENMTFSISKNIQELSEFLVDEFDITNYYDLVDYITDLYNFKVEVYEKDRALFDKIEESIQKEKEKEDTEQWKLTCVTID